MEIYFGFGDHDELTEAIRILKPFEAQINAIGNGGLVQEIHARRALQYKDCVECAGKSFPGGECFSIETKPSRELLAWDVTYAITQVNDGRKSFTLPEKTTLSLLQLNIVDATEHLDHVDPSVPGIMTVLPKQVAGSQYLPVLIDGSHRAARCLRDGIAFQVRLLTAEESWLCMQSVQRKLMAMMRLMMERGLQAPFFFPISQQSSCKGVC